MQRLSPIEIGSARRTGSYWHERPSQRKPQKVSTMLLERLVESSWPTCWTSKQARIPSNPNSNPLDLRDALLFLSCFDTHHWESYTQIAVSQWYSCIVKVVPKTSSTIQLHTTAERQSKKEMNLLRKNEYLFAMTLVNGFQQGAFPFPPTVLPNSLLRSKSFILFSLFTANAFGQ